MLGTVRIQGADNYADNTSAGAWLPSKQFTTDATFLTKLVVFVPTAIGANRVIWVFDAQSGTAGTVNPTIVLLCPNGFTTTLDFGDYGKIFKFGVYVVVATNEPSSGSTTATAGSNNDAKVVIDYKLK